MNLLAHIEDHFLIFDGAFGTVLMDGCLKPGENPTVLNITHPEEVAAIHKNYLKSGAMVVTLNTFSCSRFKLEGLPYTMEELVKAAFDCAARAVDEAGKSAYIIYDMGPCGKLLEPMGEVSFGEAYELCREQALLAEKYGADAVLIETMADLYEIKAALLAVKENTRLPVFCSITIEQNGRTYTGGCIESMAAMLESLGADAVGINCSVGPKDLLPHAKKLASLTRLPVIIQPNAGLPQEHDGVTTFDVTPEEYAEVMAELAKSGVNILGGCCGTNYDYIRLLAEKVLPLEPVKRNVAPRETACTPSVCVEVSENTPVFRLVTPENAAELSGYISSGDFDGVLDIVLDKLYDVEAEYIFLDATLLSGVSPERVSALLKHLQTAVRLPFGIAAQSAEDAETMTREYNGKALVKLL